MTNCEIRNTNNIFLMNRQLVANVVNAVLYEGYILYPYRAVSKKNQRERFTFSRVRDRCAMFVKAVEIMGPGRFASRFLGNLNDQLHH